MRRIKVVYHYIDRDTQEQVIHYADDAFLICDGLALSIIDKERGDAVIEQVRPSELFPGCYESVDGGYTEFTIDDDTYEHILRNC
jgi:uncharacterized protein (DUF952 family)